jgi:hypothetical protein
MWFKGNTPPTPLCIVIKKWAQEPPHLQDMIFFFPARNYPKWDWELVLRVGMVTGVELEVGSVLDPGL